MIGILGAGLAGLSAAYHLGDLPYTLLERNSFIGGLSTSKRVKGYTFDYGPHILFTRDEYVKNLYTQLLGENISWKDRRAYIKMMGTEVKYPLEANLHPLPADVIEDCISGVEQLPEERAKPGNFLEWIRNSFGEGIARHYMEPYNNKVWKYDLEKMGIQWLGSRVPKPDIEEMREGAKGDIGKEFGPNSKFGYPVEGGIGALPNSFSPYIRNLQLDSNIIGISGTAGNLTITYQQGENERDLCVDRILTSLPLPELVKILDEVPDDVRKAIGELVCNSLVCVNLGIDREAISDKHWLYFPEPEYVFNRCSFPMNFAASTAPPGKSSILTEITFRGGSPNVHELAIQAIEGLVSLGILKNRDEVELVDTQVFRYAYVVYRPDHQESMEKIHSYLRGRGIIPIGRFSKWEYFNMDHAILDGKLEAEAIIEASQ